MTDRELMEKMFEKLDRIEDKVHRIELQVTRNETTVISHEKDITLLKRGLLGTIAGSLVGLFFK
jgi:hypothetical protein